MPATTSAAKLQSAAAYDYDDPSLEILADLPTMTVVSINALSGGKVLIADIQPGEKMLGDIEYLTYNFAHKLAGTPQAVASYSGSGSLRLLITTKEKLDANP